MKDKVIKAIILAGGYSRRMKLKVPKQLLKIEKKPILAYSLDAFERCKLIKSIVLVVHKKYVSQCRNLVKKYRYKKIEQLCLGGRTRQQSVFNALTRIKDCNYVIIHDGVRPFVTKKIISQVLKAVKKFGAATCAVKAVDTTVEAKQGSIDSVLSRQKLWHIQTPQAFKFNLILKAHRNARAKKIFAASDDAQLLLNSKKKIKLINGSYSNIKVTTKSDLLLAKKLNRRKPR
ncbi:MAG: 2-C-methyl-D-erythritol 4-phosphate cytidylyltransferase [Omnitrophica bacterium]|nr:2-C-methyl-D-erythritol 4-phosphate cytidylyltransferase [Candidatus Omnitrophota bacterium]